MDAKLQRRVQRYGWDAAAPLYQDAWSEQLKPAHDLLLELAALKQGMRVLETACGTGLVTVRAADFVTPGGSILATDIADEMVKETAKHAVSRGFHNVETARGDAEDLAVEAGSFDAALCALGLMYVPDRLKALSKMRQAVKPGGHVAALVWGERRNCGWAEIFPIVDAQVNSEVCPLFFSLGAPGALAAAMTSAGLSHIEERRQVTELVFPDEEALLFAQIDGGAVALAAKRFSLESRREVRGSFLRSVSQYRRDDGSYAIPGEFVAAAGVCPT
jgi:ubiquinone/menaquinone biosynthesis C-methylase UbiE